MKGVFLLSSLVRMVCTSQRARYELPPPLVSINFEMYKVPFGNIFVFYNLYFQTKIWSKFLKTCLVNLFSFIYFLIENKFLKIEKTKNSFCQNLFKQKHQILRTFFFFLFSQFYTQLILHLYVAYVFTPSSSVTNYHFVFLVFKTSNKWWIPNMFCFVFFNTVLNKCLITWTLDI